MNNKQLLFSTKQYQDHLQFWSEQLNSVQDSFILQGPVLSGTVAAEYERSCFIIEKQQLELIEKYTDNRPLESFILMVSGWTVLFSRYMEQSAVVLNTPLLTVAAEETIWEPIVPLVCTADDNQSFRELLKQLNETIVRSYKYQNFPLDMCPGNIKTPLSNILVSQRGLHTNIKETEDYDLVIEMSAPEPGGNIIVSLRYNTTKFSRKFILEMGTHFNEVLLQLGELDKKIGTVAVLPPAIEEMLTVTFNDTALDIPAPHTVIGHFSAIAKRFPDHTAIIQEDITLSYIQLDEKSDRLAVYLRNEKGKYVGMLLERSPEAIICLLAIMKAGAVYVPIDPKNPAERITYILQDAGIETLLTTTTDMFRLDGFTGHLFAVDVQLEALEDVPSVQLPEPAPDDLAYLIYTSGSTGTPRGVMIEHAGLLNVALHHVQALEMKETDRYLQFMSLSFDGSLLDIFTTLLSAAALVLPGQGMIENAALLTDYIATQGVSLFTVTPSYLSALNKDPLSGVRTIISAGEAANADDLNYYATFKDVYNGYGPSEVTVNGTLLKLSAGADYEQIPIGKPGANKQLYILDDKLRLRPPGFAGEICIAGAGLARGYLNDDVLTAEKFVDNPFKSGRLYKTGDIGRWLPDGNIEFLGRKDEQIKLNGFRIDTGEIAHTLNRHPLVRSANVICCGQEVKMLAAFIQKQSGMQLVPSLGEYQVYDPFIYESMAVDEMRVTGYRLALQGAVNGKVVLDPGTGSEMILARHCIDAGAKKVYAVEMDAAAYDTAKKNLEKYGLEDKIELIYGDIVNITLPEKIDFVVSALAGNIASSDGCIPLVNMIRDKLSYEVDFLPGRYLTKIAAATITADNTFNGFSDVSIHYIKEVFAQYGYPFDLRLCVRDFDDTCILSEEGICEDLDYSGLLLPEDAVRLRLKVEKEGNMTGFVCWINALYKDFLMIDSRQPTHHLPVFIPLSGEAIFLREGNKVNLLFTRRLSDNGLNPDFIIEGHVETAEGHIYFTGSSYNHAANFRRSPLYTSLFSKDGNAVALPDTTLQGWQEYLSASLPAYMIPAVVQELSTFPLTTNGKLDKRALEELLEKSAAVTDEDALPHTDIEQLLAEIWQSVLGRKQVSIKDDFFMLGGDSIKAIQIASRMLKAGYKLDVRQIFENSVIADLARVVVPVGRIADQGSVTGEVVLTPVHYEVFLKDATDAQHFNQAVMLYAEKGLGEQATRAVFLKLQEHHDALRIVFRQQQLFNKAPGQPLALSVYNIDETEDPAAFMEARANEIQRSINLEEGPLMKVALFSSKTGDRLLIVIHHLIIDGISWRILIEDIDKLYVQFRRKQELKLPLKTNSFLEWSNGLAAYANSRKFLAEKEYWTNIIQRPLTPIERDFPVSGNSLTDTVSISFMLSAIQTEQLLTTISTAFSVEINDVLLTTLAVAVNNTFGHANVLIGMEGHGREDILDDINISRTVGWFSSFYPVILPVNNTDDLPAQLQRTKAELRKIPNKGIGYGILKYLTDSALKEGLQFDLKPALCFNYLGQFDADMENTSFSFAAESTGETQSDRRERLFDLDVRAQISSGRMHFTVTYNKLHFRAATIQSLSDQCQEILGNIITLAAAKVNQGTDQTFTYQELSMEDLDSIFS